MSPALDLLASDPSRTAQPSCSLAFGPLTSAESPVDIKSTGDEWPNIVDAIDEDDDSQLATLGLAAFNLSCRVHDFLSADAVPTWVDRIDIDSIRAELGR